MLSGIVMMLPYLDQASLWKTIAGGPRWLAGGEYGPEGGLIGTIVFIAGIVALRKMRATDISPKLRALLSEN